MPSAQLPAVEAARAESGSRLVRLDEDYVFELSDTESASLTSSPRDQLARSYGILAEHLASPAELRKRIRILLTERDDLWRERLALSSRKHDHGGGESDREALVQAQRINRQQQDVIDKLNTALRAANDQIAERTTALQALEAKVTNLTADLEAGRQIIRQFTELIQDKTSNVCQYCRRSGTLPPLPTR